MDMEKLSDLQCEATREMMDIAAECIRSTSRQRPELMWLKARYEEFRKKYKLKKSEADALIYTRMYGCEASAPTDLLKIRYWRTGRHMPQNRDTCRRLGQALELDASGTSYLLAAYMDTARDYYEREPATGTDAVYWSRRRRLEELTDDYMRRHHFKAGSRSHCQLRHQYFLNAQQYHSAPGNAGGWQKAVYSINYDTEFRRNLLLLGEIPRRTMLRHLILLMLPYLSLDKLQEALIRFGYLPLSPHHTLCGGEHLDLLLLHMIPLYEQISKAEGTAAAARWFLNCYRRLDAFFVEHEAYTLRFLYFKALNQ